MTVYQLNRDQLAELKAHYYADKIGEDLSYEELANIHDYVSDAEIYKYYNNFSFTNDDFLCSAGEDEDGKPTLEDSLLAIESRVQFIEDHGYIPWVSPYPSSTEKQLVEYLAKAKAYLNQAAYCAHLLRY